MRKQEKQKSAKTTLRNKKERSSLNKKNKTKAPKKKSAPAVVLQSDKQPVNTLQEESWLSRTWVSFKSSFAKIKASLKSNFKNNLNKSEKVVDKKWQNLHQHRRNISKKQSQALKSEQAIHHHAAKSQQLMQELADSTDQEIITAAQRYYRQSHKSQLEADSLREQLEFVLQHAAEESDRLHFKNKDNLEQTAAYHKELLEAQAANQAANAATAEQQNKQTE
jgi:hypothetical protein